ncbi:MAG: MoxR family ATPase [Gammaproteobacteria bacterium]|nr:MoxR family ATPase [Gammaproteobacteria bacterium]MCW8911012.1 MoxR family ATPase [Gammaproteobacteria bacterium]MCW9004112.1 MoxR family ATPase [Gammaproteobacteria bacterium]MCW9056444.1 MoxR family ATPase [Gammaproteobacteria bacterium]
MNNNTKLPVDLIQQSLKQATDNISSIILGKHQQIQLALTCLLANGHLLIEDLPGVGKTTLALTLAKTFGLDFHRIQFTSDLLPADVLGVSIYDTTKHLFDFHPGPIFSQVLLADEINRATPKTQSALLEGMEERQVTQDGITRILPDPFFVIATQNPTEQVGTFPLPESQLDRFLMRIEIGYPDQKAERELLIGKDRRKQIKQLESVVTSQQLLELQKAVDQVHISKALLDYLLALIRSSRLSPWFSTGLSPRAGLALQKCAQAWALLQGRDHVLPEDIQFITPSVAAHRLLIHTDYQNEDIDSLIDRLIKQVPV